MSFVRSRCRSSSSSAHTHFEGPATLGCDGMDGPLTAWSADDVDEAVDVICVYECIERRQVGALGMRVRMCTCACD